MNFDQIYVNTYNYAIKEPCMQLGHICGMNFAAIKTAYAIIDEMTSVSEKAVKELDIKFRGKGVDGALSFDAAKECDVRSYLTKISPLLCEQLCWNNINTIEMLSKRENGYSSDEYTFAHICRQYYRNNGNIPIKMYFYIKDALNMIGIEHNRLGYEVPSGRYCVGHEYAMTAYITKLTLDMKDGRKVVIEKLPLMCFNISWLYIDELKKDLSESTAKFVEDLNKALKKRK